MGEGGEGGGPGDVTVAGQVQVVAAFGEDPLGASMDFTEGEIIGGDVLVGPREALADGGELVHEGKTEVVLFRGEVDAFKAAAELAAGFPTDLAAKSAGIARGFSGSEAAHELEKDGLEEVPIFGPAAKEGTQPEIFAGGLVYVNDGEIALATGGDVEAETKVDS